MAAFALVTLQPQGYPHVGAFIEMQRLLLYSLLDLGHDVVLANNRFPAGRTAIVFGAHLISEAFPIDLPADCIVFNTEQLMAEGSVVSQRIFALAQRHQIWDYATANLLQLRRLCPQARLHRLRLGYHHQLERVAALPHRWQGDFLFYGSITPLRERILARIRPSDRLRIQAYFGVYGWHRDQLLSECRAVLNLHSQPARLLEWPRILWLVANGIPCIALLHPQTLAEDQQCSYLLAAEESDPTPELEAWFTAPQLLQAHAAEARDRFRSQEPQGLFTAALLDEALASGFQPATAPPQDCGWIRCSHQRNPDPLWYLHTYPCSSLDPRSLNDFHHQEGSFRQYHPDAAFRTHFRPPLPLEQPRGDRPVTPLRCAVVLQLSSELKAHRFFACFAANLVGRVDFLVTVNSPLLASLLRAIARDYQVNLIVRAGQDQAADLVSRYIVFDQEINSYDLCLFSHDLESDDAWFHAHNELLVGSRQRLEAIVDLFARQPDLGLLFPDYLPSRIASIGWGNSRRQLDQLLAPAGLSTACVNLLEYPAGGFFWARPQALGLLQRVARQGLHPAGPATIAAASLAEALERLPCLACEHHGYRWQKITREAGLPAAEPAR